MPAVQPFEDQSPSTETAHPQRAWLAAEPAALILQPTSLCNLDCTYCYLPARKLKRDMSPAVAEAIASGIPDAASQATMPWTDYMYSTLTLKVPE